MASFTSSHTFSFRPFFERKRKLEIPKEIFFIQEETFSRVLFILFLIFARPKRNSVMFGTECSFVTHKSFDVVGFNPIFKLSVKFLVLIPAFLN